MENFGQVDLAVTDAGVIHAVANGYGLSFNTSDTTNYFPVLYYNSTSNKWIVISDMAISGDTIQNIINTESRVDTSVMLIHLLQLVKMESLFTYVDWSSVN